MNRFIDAEAAESLERRVRAADIASIRRDRRLDLHFKLVCLGFIAAGVLGLLLSAPILDIG
jgi:hypothetical protein